MGEILVHNSVSKIYTRQLNNASNESICSGNLTSHKTQDCLRKVKSEMKSKNQFSDLYMEDVLATQQFFRHLLADSRFPGYVVLRTGTLHSTYVFLEAVGNSAYSSRKRYHLESRCDRFPYFEAAFLFKENILLCSDNCAP